MTSTNRETVAGRRRMVFIGAHPDDETFGIGGSLATYARQGVEVYIVCATRGEVGEIADPSLATPDTLAYVRELELRCACGTLRIEQPTFLGYRDSGMAGDPKNDDPRSLAQASAETVTGQLVAWLRRVQPQVVITFEPGGGYGHPDHMAISRCATAAFAAASDPARYPEAGPAYQPKKLYHTALPRQMFRDMVSRMRAAGIDLGQDISALENRGMPDEQVTTVIDVSAAIDSKMAAFQCHRTQLGQGSFFARVPPEIMRAVMSREYFACVSPTSGEACGFGGEKDLFAGLD
jgi:LmbE family N-acetylglucosaminyl deacetylase